MAMLRVALKKRSMMPALILKGTVMKKLIVFLLAALLVFAACKGGSQQEPAAPTSPSGGSEASESESTPDPVLGTVIGSFSTSSLNGDGVTNEIFGSSELTVINYWATWCPPCIEEMPYFASLHSFYEQTAEPDVQVIGVISEGGGCTPSSAKQFLESKGYEWQNIRSDDALNRVFATSEYIPQTLFVDSSGMIRYRHIGMFRNLDQLMETVQSLLNER